MEIDILIDNLTNCLVCAETGEECNTEYRLVARTITKQDAAELKAQGWRFDWSIPHQNGYEVYELLLENNVGSSGKYKGVGAHLFAIACKLSWDAGNEGYVQFTAKTDLVEHYRKMLNAKSIDWHTLYIESYGAIDLINKYFKGEQNDCC